MKKWGEHKREKERERERDRKRERETKIERKRERERETERQRHRDRERERIVFENWLVNSLYNTRATSRRSETLMMTGLSYGRTRQGVHMWQRCTTTEKEMRKASGVLKKTGELTKEAGNQERLVVKLDGSRGKIHWHLMLQLGLE